jgi:N utilization substance protein A
MAALVAPGSPVSVLIDFGLPEHLVERLVEGGIPTVERLGDMTPEQLEDLPGIDAENVERIRDAVIAWYGQYQEEGGGIDHEVQDEQPLADYGEGADGGPMVETAAEEPEAESAAEPEPEGVSTEEVEAPPGQQPLEEAGEGSASPAVDTDLPEPPHVNPDTADLADDGDGDSARLKDADQAG